LLSPQRFREVNRMSHRILVPLLFAVALAGCAVPDLGMQQPSQGPAAAPSAGGPYDPGPVVLTLDGYPGPNCDFNLFARYPENLVPHTVELKVEVRSTVTSFSNHGGFYVELPMLGVDWTESTPAGILTRLSNGRSDEPCEQLVGTVEIVNCYQGDCPSYVADEYSAISLTVN
jgi:hypothetical protein